MGKALRSAALSASSGDGGWEPPPWTNFATTAFVADCRTVLLIDEIDKADTDFQDDMLDVLDQMQFDIMEIDKTVTARNRPVIIITSNAKKDLSDPFLGRCNFHHIAFPDPEMMRMILVVHFPDLLQVGRMAAMKPSGFEIPFAGQGMVEGTPVIHKGPQ